MSLQLSNELDHSLVWSVPNRNSETKLVPKYNGTISFGFPFCKKVLKSSICKDFLSLYIATIIIKIAISSIVIGLKDSHVPLIHLPSCYRTVQ